MRFSITLPFLGLALTASATLALADGVKTGGVRRLASVSDALPDLGEVVAPLKEALPLEALPLGRGLSDRFDDVRADRLANLRKGSALHRPSRVLQKLQHDRLADIVHRDVAEGDLTPQLLVQRITSCKSSISQQVSILKGLSGEDQSAFVAPVQAISSELSSLLGLVQQFKASGNTFDVADAALGGDFSSLVQGLLGQLTDVFQLLNSLGAAVQLGPLLDSLLKEVLGLVGQLLTSLDGVVSGLLTLLSPVLSTLTGLVNGLGLGGLLSGLLGPLGIL